MISSGEIPAGCAGFSRPLPSSQSVSAGRLSGIKTIRKNAHTLPARSTDQFIVNSFFFLIKDKMQKPGKRVVDRAGKINFEGEKWGRSALACADVAWLFGITAIRSGLLRRLRALVVFHFALEYDSRGRSEALVVGVFDDLAYVHIIGPEMQSVVRASIGREPVLSVDLFAVGYKGGTKVFVRVFLLLGGDNLGHGFAAALDDLKVAHVHPKASLKVAMAFFYGLGRDVKNVGVDFVDVLLAYVKKVVLGNIFRGQDERHHVAEVFVVGGGQRDLLQSALRRKLHILDAIALIVVHNVLDQPELAGDRRAVHSLYGDVLGVSVVVPRFLEYRFPRCKLFDDLLGCGSARLG